MISVYGSTGFIGSHFCDQFKDDVITIPRENCKPLSNNILYLISTTTNYNVFDDPYLDVNTNLIKLISVIKECKDRDIVFNFVSSWFVYGDTDLPAHEDSICRPKGFYSITKKAAEDLLISYCKTFDINYRIFRLSNVYGSGDKFSKKKNALQYLLNKIKNNESIGLYHDGNFVRDYIHVHDACRAMKLCIDKAPLNETINIGSGDATKFIDIIQHAVKKIDSESSITAMEPPEFHNVVQVKDMWLDCTKLRKLGFSAEYNILRGVDEFLA